jgi:heme oxygenase
MPTSAIRFALRDATSALHERIDRAFAGFDLFDAEGYSRFLSAHARAVPPLERVVKADNAWSGWRTRSDDLRRDLARMETRIPTALSPGSMQQAGGQWGVQYVLEGSKLGGQVLASRLPPGRPRRYLAGGFDAEGWRRFQQELDLAAHAGGTDWLETAIAGARAAFAVFEDAARVEMCTVGG